MQSRQLLGRDAATEVWPPWLEDVSPNLMNWMTRAATRVKPPTSAVLGGFPSDKARPEKIRRKETTYGSIRMKASQTVMKPATYGTL